MVNAGKRMCARETGAGFPCAYNKRPPEKAACGGPVLRNKTAVTKKKIPAKYEAYIHAAGMVLLLSFMAFVTFKDIWKLFT